MAIQSLHVPEYLGDGTSNIQLFDGQSNDVTAFIVVALENSVSGNTSIVTVSGVDESTPPYTPIPLETVLVDSVLIDTNKYLKLYKTILPKASENVINVLDVFVANANQSVYCFVTDTGNTSSTDLYVRFVDIVYSTLNAIITENDAINTINDDQMYFGFLMGGQTDAVWDIPFLGYATEFGSLPNYFYTEGSNPPASAYQGTTYTPSLTGAGTGDMFVLLAVSDERMGIGALDGNVFDGAIFDVAPSAPTTPLTVTVTEANDTVSSTIGRIRLGNSSITESNDTVSARINPITGLNQTEQDDTVSAKAIVYRKYVPPLNTGTFANYSSFGSNSFGISFMPGETMCVITLTNTTNTAAYETERNAFLSNIGATTSQFNTDGNVVIGFHRRVFTSQTFVNFTVQSYFSYIIWRMQRADTFYFEVIPFDTTVSNNPKLRVANSVGTKASVMGLSFQTTPITTGSSFAIYPNSDLKTTRSTDVTVNQELYAISTVFYNPNSIYRDNGNVQYIGEQLESISESQWGSSWVTNGSYKELATTSSVVGQGYTVTIAVISETPFILVNGDAAEGDDLLTAANFTSDIIVTEDDDSISSTSLSTYTRFEEGVVLVEPTTSVSSINSASPQIGDILTLFTSDVFANSTEKSNWDSIQLNYINDIVQAGFEIEDQGSVGFNSYPTYYTPKVMSFRCNTNGATVPTPNSILNAVFMLTRNFKVQVGGTIPTNGGLVGYDYIPVLPDNWDGMFGGNQYVTLDTNVLGRLKYYFFSSVTSPNSGTLPYRTSRNSGSDSEIDQTTIHYSSEQLITSARSTYVTKETLDEYWFRASAYSPIPHYYASSFNIYAANNVVIGMSSGIYVYLQENVLNVVSFTEITEGDDTLDSSNVNRAYSSITEEDDAMLFESIQIIFGVFQEEEDDIAVSFGYHFEAPPSVPSTTFVGYSVTNVGDTLSFPAGVQNGDLVYVFPIGDELGFNDGWPNWSRADFGISLAIYSPTLTAPVVTSQKIVFVFSGVDVLSAFPFAGPPFELASIGSFGSEISYDQTATIGVNNILECTRYFDVMLVESSLGLTSSLIGEFGSSVVYTSTLETADVIFVLNDETDEGVQNVVEGLGFDFVSADGYTKTLINDYGENVNGSRIMLLPQSILVAVGSSRVEIVEEDDQSIRGEPIVSRITEDDDFIVDSYGYHYTPAEINGSQLIESAYVNAADMPNITVGENELVILLLDVNQATLDAGGYWNVGYYPRGWMDVGPNVLYAHSTFDPAPFPNESSILNGAYLYRFNFVESGPWGYLISQSYEYNMSPDSYFDGDFRTLSPELTIPDEEFVSRFSKSTAIRLNVVDYSAPPVGVTSSDLQLTIPGAVNVQHGTMTGAPDRLFTVDLVPINVVAGSVVASQSGSIDLSSSLNGDEGNEFATLLFPPITLSAYGNNPKLEILEEDDTLAAADKLIGRVNTTDGEDTIEAYMPRVLNGVEQTEQDDFIRESYGYHFDAPQPTSSIEYIGHIFVPSGDALEYPLGVQEGDLILAVSMTNSSLGASWDNFWPDWSTVGTSRLSASLYSVGNTVPTVQTDTVIFAFRGVDLRNFAGQNPLDYGSVSVEGNPDSGSQYPYILQTYPYSNQTVYGLLDLTRYFRTFYAQSTEAYNALLLEFSDSVIFSNPDNSFIAILQGEENEPEAFSLNIEPGVNIVQFSELFYQLGIPSIPGAYSLASGRSLSFTPTFVTYPTGVARAEIYEDDDVRTIGDLIYVRVTEDDDFVRDSYGYSFEAARTLGPQLIESTYVNVVDMPNITVGENEFVILVLDVTQATIDNGGYWNSSNYPDGWSGDTPNILTAHSINDPEIFASDPTEMNGAYLYRFSNVLNDGDNFYPRDDGQNGDFFGDYFTVPRNTAYYESEYTKNLESSIAVRINILDYATTPIGITSDDLQSTLTEAVNVQHGVMTGAPDRLFSVDLMPTVLSPAGLEPFPSIGIDASENIDFSASVTTGDTFEFYSTIFQPLRLVVYGNNPNLEVVEEDDITTVGDLIYARITEDDDVISEAFGYHYTPDIKTSIEYVGTNTVGFNNSFTLSSDDYNVGDLIFVYFTSNAHVYNSLGVIIENFVIDYPEFERYRSGSYYTGYSEALLYAIKFDGITKTYDLFDYVHTTVFAVRGVIPIEDVVIAYEEFQNNTRYARFESGIENTNINFRPSIELEIDNTEEKQRQKTLIRYPYFIYFGTIHLPSDTSPFPPELFSANLGGEELLYDVDIASTFSNFTTFIYGENLPVDLYYEEYTNKGRSYIYAYGPTINNNYGYFVPISGNPLSGDPDSMSWGSAYLIPQEVIFNNNRAELFEENDSIEAVIQKAGINSQVAVTEENDSVSFVASLSLESSVSITEANDTISAVSSLPARATFVENEQEDFINATSSAPVKATATLSEASDSVSATSVISVKATATITESSDTSGATARISVKANTSRTEANDTIASATSVLVKANSTNAEVNDSISSTASAPAKATAVLTEADDTRSSTAVLPLKASVTITEQGDTFESVTSGKTPLYAAMTEADDTGSSTGVISIKASSEITEADDTPSGTSKIPVVGTLITFEENDSVQSASTILVKATASNAEQDDSFSAASKILIRSSTSVTEQDDVSTSATKVAIVAISSNNEESDSITAESAILIKAISSNNEENDSVLAESAILISADASDIEQDDTFASAAVLPLKSNMSASEGDDTVASTSKVAILSAVVANEQDDYLKSIVLRTIPAFTDFVATSDFAPISNRIRYSAASFEAAAELYGLGLKTITIAVEMTADSDFETIQTRTRNAFIQFESTFDFSAISIPVPGTTYRIVYVIAEINRVNVDASMNTEDVLGLANEEFVLVEKV